MARHRRHYSRHRRYRRSRRGAATATRGAFPTLLGAGALAIPFVAQDAGLGSDPISYTISCFQNGTPQYLGNAFMGVVNNIVNNAGSIIGLGVGAGVAAWGAKKFHLRSATRIAKKWSVF